MVAWCLGFPPCIRVGKLLAFPSGSHSLQEEISEAEDCAVLCSHNLNMVPAQRYWEKLRSLHFGNIGSEVVAELSVLFRSNNFRCGTEVFAAFPDTGELCHLQ